jgi:hypothetical protein
MNGFSASMPNAFTRKQVTLSEGRQLARPIKISAALTDAGLITSQLIAKHEQASQLKPTSQPAAAQHKDRKNQSLVCGRPAVLGKQVRRQSGSK